MANLDCLKADKSKLELQFIEGIRKFMDDYDVVVKAVKIKLDKGEMGQYISDLTIEVEL